MQYDIHPELGPKTRVQTPEEVFAQVIAAWPTAHREASTGDQRSWWVGEALVAHDWAVRGRSRGYWLRLKRPNEIAE